MKIHTITFILVIIGALNWGFYVLGFDVGRYLPSGVETTVYVLVALAALYEIFSHKAYCRNCAPQNM